MNPVLKTIGGSLLCVSLAAAAQTPPPANAAVDMLKNEAAPPSIEVRGVVLSGEESPAKLEGYSGTLSYRHAFVTALMFLDFPGPKATVRTRAPRPVLHIRMEADPTNRLFLVKAENRKKANTRSVKVGQSGFGSITGMSAPDADWTVPVTIARESDDVWAVTPLQDLAAGEYGVFVPTVVAGVQAAGNAQLYGFGVD